MKRCALLLALVCLGCKDEPEIRRYQVPRERATLEGKPVIVDLTSEARPATRMLVGVLPHGDRLWFLKLMGPADDVAATQDVFEKFVKSSRFTEDKEKPIAWTVPEGWKEDRSNKDRHATFKIETKSKPLELSVTVLGQSSLLANVNRWRGQVGLGPIGQGRLKECVREIKLDENK